MNLLTSGVIPACLCNMQEYSMVGVGDMTKILYHDKANVIL